MAATAATHTTLGRTFQGEHLRNVALPLGGIGTGQVALCGDGGLRQWQLFNQSNHLAFVPDSFFAIRTGDDVRILQSEEVLNLPKQETPLINDDVIPEQQAELVRTFGGVQRTTFTGAYPFARIAYLDDRLPVEVSLEAYSPYVPLDGEASEIPAVLFSFTVSNPGPAPVSGALAATLKNAVGWDTATPIVGNTCPLFGGNISYARREGGLTSLVHENPSLEPGHPGAGQMAISTEAPDAWVLPMWDRPKAFLDRLAALQLDQRPLAEPKVTTPERVWHTGYVALPDVLETGLPNATLKGTTSNGGMAVPFSLAPGESTTVTFILSWSFPNVYVNYTQPANTHRRAIGLSRLWIGAASFTRFPSALAAAEHVVANHERLDADSRAFSEAVLDSSLPGWIGEFLAAQGALIRSPTVFRTDDGKLYGFEGTKGASTWFWHPIGGSCPLNCTHVWNYEQAISRLFPAFERTMRETDYDIAQAPEGYIPHRTLIPPFVKQIWGHVIGGPDNPALDGMLGTILKTLREVQQGAGEEWLQQYWPSAKHLLEYITATWDADGDGILTGEQPNTYDIAFYGTNMFIGSLWLAALRAGEEMARQVGESAYADDLHSRFERARDAYDAALWNGEYYIQVLAEDDPREQQYLTGCLADQLQGQWWAHQLGLGYILPEERVKANLQAILKYNIRRGFHEYDPEERAFADGDDAGLVIIAWPEGGKPERPTRYHDEVWTGIEYQVIAHLITEGFKDEALALLEDVRNRYDGAKRNPYNDIECGDHYARAMAGWTILEALAGYRYDASKAEITLRPVEPEFRGPFVAGTAWGTATVEPGSVTLAAQFGEVSLARLQVPVGLTTATLNGKAIATSIENDAIVFDAPITLRKGDVLTIS